MKHEMKLKKSPFELIKSGEKRIEIRLYDEKIKKVKIGDTIVFSKLPDLSSKITVKVYGLLMYSKFSELIDDLPIKLMGHKEEQKNYLKNSMYEIYSSEDEKKYGVVGIRFKVIKI